MNIETAELQVSAQQALRGLGIAAAEDKSWAIVAELGWLLVAVPEELDGLGQGLSAACALYRELGASVAAAPYLPAMLAIDAVCRSELPDRAGWIARLTGGEFVTASLLDSPGPMAETVSGRLKLTGMACAVSSADKASHVLMTTADTRHVFLAPLNQHGVEIVPRPTWDATRRLFDVRFIDFEVPSELILARGAAAQTLAELLAMHRDFALAADSVGGACALLELTVEYLKTRRQFGRPLAMFQALKHRCADLKAMTAAAEALLLENLDKARHGSEPEIMAKQAKSLACAAYFRVAEESLQLHGGIGMTSEHVCHKFLKRALLNAQLGRPDGSYELDIAASTLRCV
jgi:alkylation response protein AidB-like acyl-CoA dehydrogenase